MFLYQPPEPPKTQRRIKGFVADPRADQTMRHLSRHWIPANHEKLQEIQARYAEGVYKGQRQELLNDLQDDPILYLNCNKNLRLLVEDEGNGIDPFATLLALEEEKISRLIHSPPEASTHRLREMNKQQALRLQHSFLSARAARVISEKAHVSPSAVYTATTLRQLGLNLIAWNYPQIYHQALARQRNEGADLHVELQRLLGLSPAKIAERLAQEWHLAPEIRDSLALKNSSASSTASLGIEQVIELAEFCAQIQDEKNYRLRNNLWEEKYAKLESVIGSGGIAEIQAYVKETLTQYVHLAPVLSDIPCLATAPELPLPSAAAETKVINPYIAKCPDYAQEYFKPLDSMLLPQGVSVTALKYVVESLTPKLGFQNGCLYLIPKNATELKPALRFGDTALAHYGHFLKTTQNGISASLFLSSPVKKQGIGVDGVPVVFVCAAFDHPQHDGVLYLELSERIKNDANHETVLFFLALRHAVQDCLGRLAAH